MARMFKGNPVNADEWKSVDKIYDMDADVVWAVSIKIGKVYTRQSFSVKLWALEYVTNKANFWLLWTGERFTMTRDLEVMRAFRPKLLEKLEAWMAQNGDNLADCPAIEIEPAKDRPSRKRKRRFSRPPLRIV